MYYVTYKFGNMKIGHIFFRSFLNETNNFFLEITFRFAFRLLRITCRFSFKLLRITCRFAFELLRNKRKTINAITLRISHTWSSIRARLIAGNKYCTRQEQECIYTRAAMDVMALFGVAVECHGPFWCSGGGPWPFLL